MAEERKVGADSVRVSGKFFSIDDLIENVERNAISPSQWNKVGANLLAVVLAVTMHFLGNNAVQIVGVIAALFIHEVGHFIGLKCTGCNDASLGIGLLGPFALGSEGLSAGRKAIVALFGPALGLVAASVVVVINNYSPAPFLSALSHGLVFVSTLNLIPVKPFDGYAVVEHLVFIRHPKVQLFYLGTAGVLSFFLYVASFYRHDHPFYAFFFIILFYLMFAGLKKADNMADMIIRLRKIGVEDFTLGHYRSKTIKDMEFSLALFDIQNEMDLSLLLREVWDQAWEVPASRAETIIVLVMFITMLVGSVTSPVAIQIFAAVL